MFTRVGQMLAAHEDLKRKIEEMEQKYDQGPFWLILSIRLPKHTDRDGIKILSESDDIFPIIYHNAVAKSLFGRFPNSFQSAKILSSHRSGGFYLYPAFFAGHPS